MTQLTPLYNAYFKAQDHFADARAATRGAEANRFEGGEVDVIHHYLEAGLMLASYFEPRARHQNHLLCELTLRHLYFDLLAAIEDPQRSRIFRRVCLDSVYMPLLALQRYYSASQQGDHEFLKLKQQLRRIQAPFD